jgi:hypothetical protein
MVAVVHLLEIELFVGDDVRVDAGELVVLVSTEDVTEQTVVVGRVLWSRIGDVLHLAR